MKPIGLVAGSGKIVGQVLNEAKAQGKEVFVVALKGHAQEEFLPEGIPCVWIRPGEAAKGFDALHKAGVEQLCFIGAVRRPSLAELRPDWRAAKFFAKVGISFLGDDDLLKCVLKEMEAEGFQVVGVHEVLPSLLAKEKIYTKKKPSKEDWISIEKGMKVAKSLGALDVGQAVVVQNDLILAVEGIEGTDALIQRSKALHRKGKGGILVKACKPQQERRMDLPTIGERTLLNMKEAGLRGVAVEAGSSLIADEAETVKLADKLGLFVTGYVFKG